MTAPQHGRRSSLAEVARRAGVSISTVSKVVNGRADVARATRERVEEAVRHFSYVGPRERKNVDELSVTLLTRSMTSPYTLELMRGAASSAEAADADLLLSVFSDESRDLAWIDELSRRGRDAVVAVTSVLSAEHYRRFDELAIPLVVVDPLNAPDPEIYSVGATNWNGGVAATEHLLDLGHTRIGMLTGVRQAHASRAREQGYLGALAAAGLAVDPALVIPGDFTFESGVATGSALFDLAHPPTAVFAASDFQALGVLEAARQRGRRVPDDISVVGFDDLVLAHTSAPPLTTVRQPLLEMGALAVQVALDLVKGTARGTHHTELATSLVVRSSTASR